MIPKLVSIVALLFILLGSVRAQDTYSIVAVDTITGEIGSAGASCVTFDVALISDMHPGIGVIHTQASYNDANQSYARALLDSGHTPQQIIDSLAANDVQGNPGIRQYGAVVLQGGGASAGYTGQACMDYKGHLLGPGYVIQGNILLGRGILDSMEARFLRTSGPLADRLMAALQGANVPGADTRCAKFGTSSLSAFIRVARPGDTEGQFLLDLRVVFVGYDVEPVDTLQKDFNRWKAASGVTAPSSRQTAQLDLSPNPVRHGASLRYRIAERASVTLSLYDGLGREALVLVDQQQQEAGEHEIILDGKELPAGTYYCRMETGGAVVTRKLVVD